MGDSNLSVACPFNTDPLAQVSTDHKAAICSNFIWFYSLHMQLLLDPSTHLLIGEQLQQPMNQSYQEVLYNNLLP